jgi:DNA polymerase V
MEQKLPLFSSQIEAGFASAADDHVDRTIDLNELLILHPAATFFVKVKGDSMKNAGIHPGDILVVDRSLEPTSGRIVVAILDGEFTVKRLILENGEAILIPENPSFLPIRIAKERDFQVWGTVTYVIKDLLRN